MTSADLARAPHPSRSDVVGLRLRPGRPILRRDAATLQIGLTDPVRMPDVGAVHSLLTDLGAVVDAEESDREPLSDPLLRARLLDELRVAGHLTAAISTGPDGNRDSTVELHGRVAAAGTVGLLTDDAFDHAPVVQALAAAGLCVDESRPTAWLIVSAGPLQRGQVDDLVRSGTAHLIVAGHDDTRRVGPFVLPGVTACLRCVDAHEAHDDPRRPLLIEQAARAARLDPVPVAPIQEQLALAWAARDLACFAAGGEPSTWSATVDIPALGAVPAAPLVRRWLRHPHCGCAWDRIGLAP